MDTLFTPWRFDYITQPAAEVATCFICAASAEPDEPERLVVATTDHHVVIVNRHPYSNGHLMIAPRSHWASPAEVSPPASVEFWPLVLRAHRVLTAAYRPHGFNFGMNLGACAGAGVPGHYHFHLVPRWHGDTNFMTATAGTRLVPEEPLATARRLRPLFATEVA